MVKNKVSEKQTTVTQVKSLELMDIYKLKKNELFFTIKENKKYFYKIIDYVPTLIGVIKKDLFFPKVPTITKYELEEIIKQMD